MFLVSFQNIKNNNNLQDKIIITTELCFQVEKTFFLSFLTKNQVLI